MYQVNDLFENIKHISIVNNDKFNFKFIDLFAGIGGIRYPYQKYGGKCVFSSEIDRFAIKTYEANWNEIPSGDITKIDVKDIPTFDILLAGFPCQAFSIAGKRKGFNDTRGTMFFEIQRILEYHKPKCFMLENVKGLLNHNNGNTFNVIKDIIINKLNYKLYYKVLNARNFGLPQNRERIILVGFKNKDIDFDFPNPLYTNTKLGDILDDNVDKKYTISDKLWESHQKRKEKNKLKGNGFGYCLFDKDSKYTSTLSARYYKDGSEILIKQENKNPRKLTPREVARLQGFPEDFKLVVSDTQCYKQFGNSVPVKMIDAVAYQILKTLKENNEIN